MFGLLSRRIEYISGESTSDISSLESSDSEVESWTRRATFGDDDEDEFDRHTNTRTSRSTRDARSPSGHSRRSSNIHDPVAESSVGTSRSHGARTTHHRTGPSTSEPNVASSTNQIEGEETVRRRRSRTHGSTETDRSGVRRVKLRRRRDSHIYETIICTFFKIKKIVSIYSYHFFFFPLLLCQSNIHVHSMQHGIFSLLLFYVLDLLVHG